MEEKEGEKLFMDVCICVTALNSALFNIVVNIYLQLSTKKIWQGCYRQNDENQREENPAAQTQKPFKTPLPTLFLFP